MMNYQCHANFDRKATQASWLRGKIAQVTRWGHIIKSFLLLPLSSGQEQAYHAMSFMLLTEGKTFAHTMSAFRATPQGQSLLQRRPSFRAAYGDLSALESYPSGSVGHAYAQFMRRCGLDTDFYLGKALEHSLSFTNDPESAWFHLRVDANHDLRHVIAGYEADKFGEVCLLWFRFGQIRHWGIFTLGLLGVLSLIFTHRGPVLSALREACNRGRGARNLDLVPWEDELDRPLAMHRAALGLAPPIHYPKSVAPEAYL